jgi:hypothetical protein
LKDLSLWLMLNLCSMNVSLGLRFIIYDMKRLDYISSNVFKNSSDVAKLHWELTMC